MKSFQMKLEKCQSGNPFNEKWKLVLFSLPSSPLDINKLSTPFLMKIQMRKKANNNKRGSVWKVKHETREIY